MNRARHQTAGIQALPAPAHPQVDDLDLQAELVEVIAAALARAIVASIRRDESSALESGLP